MRTALQGSFTREAGVLRSAESLTLAGAHALDARTRLGPPTTAAAWELANLCDVGLALAGSAHAREESRGAHTRTDFPDRDDAQLPRPPHPPMIGDRSTRTGRLVPNMTPPARPAPTNAVHPPIGAVREAVARALAEDLTPVGDITSALLPPEARAEAALVARADGVLAGRLCVDEVLLQVDPTITVEWRADDGDHIAAGQTLAVIAGPLPGILTAERTALNFLGHLSGVATATSRFVEALAAAGETHLKVWDTRKTTPGLRALEKAAVRAGGAQNHRGNLSEWVLLKDNHLTVLGIDEAVRQTRARWPGRLAHVECDTFEQVVAALDAGADALLLDNMTPDQVRACVAEVDRRTPAGRSPPLPRRDLRRHHPRHHRVLRRVRCRPRVDRVDHQLRGRARHRPRHRRRALTIRPARRSLSPQT